MENASKALIIAGAILLSILIIGLGMMVFNQAKEAMTGTGMDKTKIATYNSTFTDYEGTNVNGTRARSLCDTVRNHNITTAAEDESLLVGINGKNDTASINAAKASFKAGKTYTITCEYDAKTGYVNNITVVEAGTKRGN